MYTLSISYILSLLSTLCWVFAQLPQQIENYTNKSADGLSREFLALWMLGDSSNLVGCILTHQLPFQIYLSVYFVFNDIVLNYQYLHYHKNEEKDEIFDEESMVEIIDGQIPNNQSNYNSINNSIPKLSKTHFMAATILSASSITNASPITHLNLLNPISVENSNIDYGYLIAWFCTCIYCISRIPQLYKNYKRKSVDGISPWLFTFALLGNVTYALSILTNPINNIERKQFLIKELPYLIGSLGTVFFDSFYFHQRWLYGVEDY